MYETPDLERVCNVSGKGEVVTEQHLANLSTDLKSEARSIQDLREPH